MESTEMIAVLLGEVRRQTAEMDGCQERLSQLSNDRRQLIAELRSHKVRYSVIAEAAGVHEGTIKSHMALWKKMNASDTNVEQCLTISPDTSQDAAANSA